MKRKKQVEEKYLRLVAAAKLKGETAECQICGNDYRIKEDEVRCTNGHPFCARCLTAICWELVGGGVKVSVP